MCLGCSDDLLQFNVVRRKKDVFNIIYFRFLQYTVLVSKEEESKKERD